MDHCSPLDFAVLALRGCSTECVGVLEVAEIIAWGDVPVLEPGGGFYYARYWIACGSVQLFVAKILSYFVV